MNVVKILLVLGLGYVALTQKSEKTRNMLLVVTGLLAFCMFSVEGLMVSDGAECIETAVLAGGPSDEDANATACEGVFITGDPATDQPACAEAGGGSVCSYTMGQREVGVADLPVLFPSCTGGKVVKSTPPTDLSGELCETAQASRISYSDYCGPDATCSGSPLAPEVSADKSNVCNENIFNYQSTCECNDDAKTWSNGECTTPQAPQ